MAILLIFSLIFSITGAAPLFKSHENFLKIKCRGSHFLKTPSPECEAFLLRHAPTTTQHPFHPSPVTPTTPQAPTSHLPSTTTPPVVAVVRGPANATIYLFPTKAARPMTVLANWVKAVIACCSIISSIYGAVVAFLRFQKKWDRRRALSLGLVGGRRSRGSLTPRVSSIPLQLRLGAPASL